MRPKIIVISKDDESTFRFLSDGWHDIKTQMRDRKKADALMAKCTKAIEAGKDVPDTIKRLEKAGFACRRMGKGDEWIDDFEKKFLPKKR